MADTLTLAEYHQYRDEPQPPNGDTPVEEPELDPEPEPPPIAALEPVKTCAQCGKPLPRGRRKFCGVECDEEHIRAKRRERHARERAALKALNGSTLDAAPLGRDVDPHGSTEGEQPQVESKTLTQMGQGHATAPTIVGVLAELLEIPNIAVDMIVGGVQLSVRRA
jgi:hypothetical protein